jgi:hypothetical protein
MNRIDDSRPEFAVEESGVSQSLIQSFSQSLCELVTSPRRRDCLSHDFQPMKNVRGLCDDD